MISPEDDGIVVLRSDKDPFVLTNKLGQDVYTSLIDMVEDRRDERLTSIDEKLVSITASIDEKLSAITERFERRLTAECGNVRLEMNGLRTEMAHQRADLMKWAMVFWVSQAAAAAAIVTALR